jgi:predicted NAD/FAD-binding protein
MRIAVVGSGIAGNGAAWTLSRRYHVTVYERELRPGGHSHTVTVDYDGERIAVDTGFIVFNELNYPEFTQLLAHLGVETVASDMSFALSADNGRFEWKGGGSNLIDMLRGLFAQPANLLSPSYLSMLRHILRFNAMSLCDLRSGRLAGLSLGQYFARTGCSPRLLCDYLAPMGGAIWSTSAEEMLNFPAENFIAFFDNHRLLHRARPIWRTVKGGSRSYVDRLVPDFRKRLRLGCAVTSIRRTPHGVIVDDSLGHSESYDHVVIAAHSDEALKLLADPNPQERAILSAIRYAPNVAYLHRDPNLMPRRKRAWASWNFLRWPRERSPVNDVAVTYWMNRLQNIDPSRPLFVSLNPPFAPDPNLTFGRYDYHHPQYDVAAFAAQKRIGDIQGRRRTWFCGAWHGYGFHEDGLRSALAVAEALGVVAPWKISATALAQAAE